MQILDVISVKQVFSVMVGDWTGLKGIT